MTYERPKAVLEVVRQAGGRVVGRTRLQKCMCGLELTGLGYGFSFSYKHFGPFSEDLKLACDDADALGLIREERKVASWGGDYSVFVAASSEDAAPESETWEARVALLSVMTSSDAVSLELAVTAAFLASRGIPNPWEEVAERKQSKASAEALSKAKALYNSMRLVEVPTPLPAIN